MLSCRRVVALEVAVRAVHGYPRPAAGRQGTREPAVCAALRGCVSAEQFGQEQARLTTEIENLEHDTTTAIEQQIRADDLAARFDQVATLLSELNLGDLWDHATEDEKRQLLDELLAAVTVHPDRLAVTIHGAPALNVAFSEVGLKDSELSRVEGGT